MTRNLSPFECKKIIVQQLENDNFIQHYSDKITEIITVLKLESLNGSTGANFYEQIASWVIDHYSMMKSNVQAFFQTVPYQTLSDIVKQYFINLVTNLSKKLNEQPVSNEMFSIKNNNYNHYASYNYPYPPQNYHMSNPSMMFQHPPYYGNNTEQFEKIYREQLQYYMQMQQMPMNFPSYMQGYGINPENNSHMKVPIPNSSMPEQIPRQPNISISKPTMGGRNILDHRSEAQLSKNSLKQPITSTKSLQDYEESFKRYYDMYGKNLGTQAPFRIIPPSKKRGVKTRIVQNFNKKKQKVFQGMQKISIQKQNQSSDLQVVENPNIPKIKKTDKKQKSVAYWFVGKQKLAEPNSQLSNCLCRGFVNDQNTFKCAKCDKIYHYDCLKKIKPQQQESLNCPFCFMKLLDPLNQVTETIQLQFLENISENKIAMHVNFQQFFNQIKNKGSQYEIQLRCMRLEDAINKNPEYTWPDQCVISLNGQKTLQFQALQLHSSVKKRKDSSIFITYMVYHQSKNFQSLANTRIGMQIKNIHTAEMSQKKIRNNFVFIAGVYLTKKKQVQELYEQIVNREDNKVKFAQTYFNLPDQEQIAIEQIKVNLLDPYTWNIIETPSRGTKCSHGQCFDLKTYIGFMNIQRNRNWKCPVCSKECRDLLIDIQQEEAIKEYCKQIKQNPERSLAPQIVFHKDGQTLFSIQSEGDEQDNMNKSKEQKIKEKDSKE